MSLRGLGPGEERTVLTGKKLPGDPHESYGSNVSNTLQVTRSWTIVKANAIPTVIQRSSLE
jgi:hypothetical protein